MNVSPNELRKETIRLLNRVEKEMKEIEQEAAATFGLSPFQIPDKYGNFLYASLITSKLSALNTLAILNDKR